MVKKYFGTDGIRGKVGDYPITPDFMLKLGWAAGRVFAKKNHHQVLIGKDTRISGYMFESALEAGLSAAGAHTQLVGPMPTPAIAYLTRTFRARAGIVISASHNPYYDNGIKFFSAEGMKLDDDIEAEIEEQIDRPMSAVDSAHIGKVVRMNDAAGRYIEFCKGTIPARMDFSGVKMVIDCAHGATYHVAPHVFKEVGAKVIPIGIQPDGLNINADCGSTKPEQLCQQVLAQQADLGIALDGDGDRLIMVDRHGEVVDGDELLYIIAKSRMPDKFRGPVVGTVMTNLGLEHALAEIGLELERAAVGDRYVMESLLRHDAILGGESSGHIICRDRSTTGDGIIAALQVLAAMWASGSALHELKSGVRKYPQCLVNVKVQEKPDLATHQGIQTGVREVEQELGTRGRVLLRPSGTEPLIRVMVEGEDGELVHRLAHQLAAYVQQQLSA